MPLKTKLRVLIIDDYPDEVDPLIIIINKYSDKYEMSFVKATSKIEAFALMNGEKYDLILLDINWEKENKPKEGIQILKEIRSSDFSKLPVIMITNYGEMGYQKMSLDLGCDGFLMKEKDLRTERLCSLEYIIEKALKMGQLRLRNLESVAIQDHDKDTEKKPFKQKLLSLSSDHALLCGTSKPMVELFQDIIRISAEPDPVNVLLLGETGVGKSTVARMISDLSGRTGPMYEIVLNSIPPDLIDSTLFGIESRIATGVDKNIGIIEYCHKGTLFLDEIGDLPIPIQVKLLRAIRDKKIVRVGGKEEITVDFMLITATNKELQSLVKNGTFRLDLFQRICGVELRIPTLSERFLADPSELDYLIQEEKKKFDFIRFMRSKQLLLPRLAGTM